MIVAYFDLDLHLLDSTKASQVPSAGSVIHQGLRDSIVDSIKPSCVFLNQARLTLWVLVALLHAQQTRVGTRSPRQLSRTLNSTVAPEYLNGPCIR